MDLKTALQTATQLPTHINGELAPHYTWLNECKDFFKIIYNEKCDPASILDVMNYRANGVERFYVKFVKTFREDGSTRKSSEWDKQVFFHKKWARKDIRIENVTFDIVGLKRNTTKLPAGVLITNIKFS